MQVKQFQQMSIEIYMFFQAQLILAWQDPKPVKYFRI